MTIDYKADEKLVLSLQKKLTSSSRISSLQFFVRVPRIVQAVQLCLEQCLQSITNDTERRTVETERAISRGSHSSETYDAGIASIVEKVNASPLSRREKIWHWYLQIRSFADSSI